jgi:hypothetical protein
MRESRSFSWLLLAGFAFGLMANAPAAAQNRQTVETRVTARGDYLYLRWSGRHPWDAQLMSGGALLMAEYRTRDGGAAADCLGEVGRHGTPDPRGRRATLPHSQGCLGLRGEVERRPQDRMLRFHLPEATTATPAGPVCLYFRLPNQRVLPVRRADRQGTETARFRYAAWEEAASSEAEQRFLRARAEELRRAIQVKAQDINAQETINARNAWTSREGCDFIQAPELDRQAQERPLAQPHEQEEVARRVCMMRVWYADSLLTALSLPERLQRGWVQPPAVVDRLLGLVPQRQGDPAASARRAQAAEFRRDWERLAPSMRQYRDGILHGGWRYPHFGTFRDRLSLQSFTEAVAAEVGQALARQERPRPESAAGVAGGMLEAYTRCVDDGQRQLATTYRNAQELRARDPAVRAGLRQAMVRECQGGIDKLETLRAEHAALLAELQQAEAALAASPARPTLDSRAQDLNLAACQP